MVTFLHYDIICLSETILDSLIETNDIRIDIEGYNLIRVDFPGNKKGEVYLCIIRTIYF